MPGDSEPSGDAIVALEPGLVHTRVPRASAIVAAIARYPAIAASAPSSESVLAALDPAGGAADTDLVITALLAAAVGASWPPPASLPLPAAAAVDPRLARRILEDLWLGPGLVKAVCGREARWHDGPGAIEQVSADHSALVALTRAPRPRALITRRSQAEALFLVMEHGLSGLFEHVVTPDDLPPLAASRSGPALDAALTAEARRRLGRQSSRIARLSKRV